MSYTPGPWEVELNDRGEPVAIVRPTGDPSAACVCPECTKTGRTWDGRTYYNLVTTDSHVYGPTLQDARLMAAAPDMLSALKEAEDKVHREYCGADCDPVCDQIRAAINKAEGKSA